MAHISNKVGKFDWGQSSSCTHIVTCSPMESEVKSWNIATPNGGHLDTQQVLPLQEHVFCMSLYMR
jgi:hypothetical protein